MSSQAEKVIAIVRDQLKYSGAISLDSEFEALGADSLDQVELVMAIESAFNIEISDTKARGILTVGDAVRIVSELSGDKAV